MTQLNPLQTTEKSPSDVQFQRKFWGVIVISILASLAYAYSLSNLLKLEPTMVVYIKMAVYVTAIGLAVTSFILAIRRQVDLALTVIFYFLLIAQVANPATTQGRTLYATFTMLVMGTLMIGWLLPRSAWRRNAAFLAGAFILAWVFEWIDPSWRVDTGATGAVGPAVAIIFSVILVALVVRETWGGSMRNKLLIAFISVTVVAAGALAVYVFTSTSNILQQGLERELSAHTTEIAIRVGDLFNEQINTLTAVSLNEVLQGAVEESNDAYEGGATAIQAELDAKDAQWRTADEADNNNDPLVRENLTNEVALELIEFQQAFPNNVEVFITDVYGGLSGTTNRTSDYYQADEGWWQAAYNDGQGAIYISEPEYDESADALAVLIAMPLRDRETGEITGVLRTTYLASALETILDNPVGETDETDLFVPGEVASHFHEGEYTAVEPGEFEELQAVADQGMVEMDYEGIPSVVVQAPMQTLEGNPAVDNLGWIIVFHQEGEEAFAPVNAQIRGVLIVMAVVVALAVGAAFFFSVYLVRPVIQLTQTAEEVAAGNLNSRAEVTTTDEVGMLASTFNNMTSELQDTLEGLEQRVAERTKALATSAEVTRRLSTVTDPAQLAKEVVQEVRDAFEYYYAQIYLLDEAGENLVLTGGTGEAGATMVSRGHSLPKGRGLVGRAADTNASVFVSDTAQEEGWLPNELLPETKAEAAIPISVGGQVLGVLDVQHSVTGGLTADDVTLLESLAGQVAISLQNARTYEQSRKQAELESLVNVIGQKIQRATSMEETLQTAIRELGTAIGASRVRASLKPASDGDLQTVLVEPAEPVPATEVEDSEPTTEPEDAPAE